MATTLTDRFAGAVASASTARLTGTPTAYSMDRLGGLLLLSGDMTDGDDVLLLSGDMTDGDDAQRLSGTFVTVASTITDRL